MYLFLLCGLLLASACKKNDVAPAAAAETSTALAGSIDAGSLGQPNALVYISQPLYSALERGSNIEVKQISASEFKALDVIKAPVDIEPADPCANAWADYDAYIAANLATFQAWANKYCRPFRSCWCHPICGLCVMFQINPTRLCAVEAYSNPVKAFAF